jgi:hypothetical protein
LKRASAGFEKNEFAEGKIGMFHFALSTVLYVVIGYVLLQGTVLAFWGIRALRSRRAEVPADNPEPTIRGWLDDYGLSTKAVSDPAWNFGLLTTLPNGESIYIIQMKDPRDFISLQSNLAISPEHQAILKAMPTAYFEKLAQELALKVFLAKMVLATRMRLSDVSLFSQLPIITDLTKGEFIKHMDDMSNAITLARNILSLGVDRAPRLVSHKDTRMDEHR